MKQGSLSTIRLGLCADSEHWSQADFGYFISMSQEVAQEAGPKPNKPQVETVVAPHSFIEVPLGWGLPKGPLASVLKTVTRSLTRL